MGWFPINNLLFITIHMVSDKNVPIADKIFLAINIHDILIPVCLSNHYYHSRQTEKVFCYVLLCFAMVFCVVICILLLFIYM